MRWYWTSALLQVQRNRRFHPRIDVRGRIHARVASQDVRPMLLIECPRMLFPFARQNSGIDNT